MIFCRPLSKTWHVAVALIIISGCDATPNRTLTGTVTLDDKPLPNGRITLVPIGSGATAGGRIENGEFRIGPVKGPLPGNYLVRISSLQPTGRQINHPESATGMMDEMREVVPGRYNERSDLSIEVAAEGDNQFNFKLESGKP